MDGSSAARSTGLGHHAAVRGPFAAARSLAVSLGTALICTFALLPTSAAAGTSAGASEAAAARPGAPHFELPALDGTALRLDALRGEVVYLDFWASWCPPCLRSFPWMNALAERHREAGLRVVAVNLDSEREAALRFLAETGANFDIVFDPEGESAEAYGLRGMPSSYVIDRDGRVAHAHVGFRSKDAARVEAVISRVLAERAPALAAAKEGAR